MHRSAIADRNCIFYIFPQQRFQRCGVLVLLPLDPSLGSSGELPAKVCLERVFGQDVWVLR